MNRFWRRCADAISLHASLGILATVLALPSLALAQDYPTKPVKIIVPSAAGGGTDTYARLMAAQLGESFKQQFVVDNHPGASGIVGADIAAHAAPDGYTLLISANPALVVNPSLFKKLPYDAERDFTPIARGVISPLVFVVHGSVPARTMAELVALGKTDPGKLTYGSAGSGSTTSLGVRMLEEATGAKFQHIAYKGLGQAYQDLVAGNISFMLSDYIVVLSHIRAGKVFALASTDRSSLLPNVPTLGEVGFPELMGVHASFTVAGPAGIPSAIVRRLNAEVNRIMKVPAVQARLESHAMIPNFETPEEFAATLKRERAMWGTVIRRVGIAADQ